ncbi:STE20-related kinase adapter protein alpha-like [Apostichopus japonicus]|uniref:STE20-related kinase adapter protein alpha-like n=1 Tax=Stichopus japonicus TaxID=307972 RepID=UPI003AB4A164
MVFKNPCCCLKTSRIGYSGSSEELDNLTATQKPTEGKSQVLPVDDPHFSTISIMEGQDLKPVASDYQILGLICHVYDGSASIHVARHVSSGHYLSVKKVDLDMLDREESGLGSLHKELSLMRLMQHEHVLPYYSAFVADRELWVVLPLMEQGSARDLLDKHFPDGLGETAIALILHDILLALDYIHQMGYIHRSIKASHIFLSRSGGVYLSGFRTAISMIREGQRLRAIHDFPANTVQNLHWLAPETLEQNLLGYDSRSDIYSLGITACELANGCIPFSDMVPMKMLLEKINSTTPKLLDSVTLRDSEGDTSDSQTRRDSGIGGSSYPTLGNEPNPYNRQFSAEFHNFIEVCLRHDPNKRPSAAELLQHEFFKQVKKKTTQEVLSSMLQSVKPVSYTPCYVSSTDVANSVRNLESINLSDEWDFD